MRVQLIVHDNNIVLAKMGRMDEGSLEPRPMRTPTACQRGEIDHGGGINQFYFGVFIKIYINRMPLNIARTYY